MPMETCVGFGSGVDAVCERGLEFLNIIASFASKDGEHDVRASGAFEHCQVNSTRTCPRGSVNRGSYVIEEPAPTQTRERKRRTWYGGVRASGHLSAARR
jgi:hypothetical protein